ncbi:hypothetical protein [Streptomyces albidoflavus]|uniref:hypothetical protein n=1 Tax=Streptomyces albidoflavus TaxID=1886 RepID=UPI003D0A3810
MDQPATYNPLFDPARDPAPKPCTVDLALAMAREALADCATKNVHARSQMISAAAGLHFTLHQLVIVLDAERGEG